MALGREQELHTIPIYIHRAPVERVNSFRSTLAKTWSGQLVQLESVVRIVNAQPLLAQEETEEGGYCGTCTVCCTACYMAVAISREWWELLIASLGLSFHPCRTFTFRGAGGQLEASSRIQTVPGSNRLFSPPSCKRSIQAAEIRRSRLRAFNSNTADSWTQNNWSCCCLDFTYPHSQCAIDAQYILFHVFIILGLFLSLYLHPTTVVNKCYCNWTVELEEASLSVLCFPYCCSTSIPEGLHLL